MNDAGGAISRIRAVLAESGRMLLSVHRNPDGDALGSQLALMLALERIGKSVTVRNLDPVPEFYRFLPHADRIRSGPAVDGSFDALVVLDCEPERTGLFDGLYPANSLINIDHHITNSCAWPLTWLDTSAAATGEMIYRLVKELGAPIDRDIALCIYTAIFTDTGSFRYSNTSPGAMRIAAEMLEAGANPWLVAENVYESVSYARIKLLGAVLSGMERNSDGRIAWVVVTDDLYRRTGTSGEDTENFINHARSVKGVEAAVLFRQTGEKQYKISFRSKGRIDVSAVASSLGGGGHRNAAGCILDGDIMDVVARVIGSLERSLPAL